MISSSGCSLQNLGRQDLSVVWYAPYKARIIGLEVCSIVLTSHSMAVNECTAIIYSTVLGTCKHFFSRLDSGSFIFYNTQLVCKHITTGSTVVT